MTETSRSNDKALGRIVSELHAAISQQRWDDAAALLPCFILHPPPNLPFNCLWKVLDIVCRRAGSMPDTLRRQAWKDVCELGVSMEEVVLDSVPSPISYTHTGIDNVLKLLDGVSTSSLVSGWVGEQRVVSINETRVSYLMYHRWLSSSQTNTSDQPTGDGEEADKAKEMQQARKIYIRLKQSFSLLKEPNEWMLLLYLHLESMVVGQDAAAVTLATYLSSNICRPAALRLALHCYRTCIPTPISNQLQVLKDLVMLCPSDPLVLPYVDLLLTNNGLNKLVNNVLIKQQDRAACDSGLSAEEDDSPSDHSTPLDVSLSCLLRSGDTVSVLLSCTDVVLRLLQYRQFVWTEKPWATLTALLTTFYSAWIRCWLCELCTHSRKEVRKLVREVRGVWQYLVWKPPPPKLTPSTARVLLHHVFAAHVFCYSKEYVSMGKRVLAANGLLQDLNRLMMPPGPHLHQFKIYAKEKRAKVGAGGQIS